jgi:hypothetical protein
LKKQQILRQLWVAQVAAKMAAGFAAHLLVWPAFGEPVAEAWPAHWMALLAERVLVDLAQVCRRALLEHRAAKSRQAEPGAAAAWQVVVEDAQALKNQQVWMLAV